MSGTGDYDGEPPTPEGEEEKPAESRDKNREKRSKALDIITMLFADDISDWIIHTGKQLLEYVSGM
ncbi:MULTISPECIES: hypothetical protein [unclassified Streptomyces]|uniref:hypothetical protein n=1 Tax=unclassified Streptomyces TaxID=2593676 RepID=UPI002966E5F1|nr:hypothetical protein [Streptomyces sp. SJL17-1]